MLMYAVKVYGELKCVCEDYFQATHVAAESLGKYDVVVDGDIAIDPIEVDRGMDRTEPALDYVDVHWAEYRQTGSIYFITVKTRKSFIRQDKQSGVQYGMIGRYVAYSRESIDDAVHVLISGLAKFNIDATEFQIVHLEDDDV